MNPELWQAAAAFVAGSGLASLFRVRSLNRRDDANSAVALAGAYAKLIDQLEHRIKMLETENLELRSRILHLEEAFNGRKNSA